VGGLADTVEDANPANLEQGTASGVVFHEASAAALLQAITRALDLYQDKPQWKKIQKTGMKKDFSWKKSGRKYLDLYDLALQDRQSRGNGHINKAASSA
jgi:starch synthase